MPGSNLRFLVVEDHEFQRHMLIQLLRTLGAEAVHGAVDGHSALQVLRDPDRPVDIVVSDLSMPGMDGMEFIRHLSEAGTRVSLILASALEPSLLASIANMAQAYKVTLLGVIGKPAAAVKLTPLIELHRSLGARPATPDAGFPIEEVAQAWTDSEFEPWFVPRVDLQSGVVRAFDASPRWRHPTQGLLLPEAFLPSIEARGLNDDFVWSMLQKCVTHCRSWRADGLDAAVCVNLGFDALADVKMAARVRQIASIAALDPGHVILGVSEAALNTEQGRVLENLARLRVDGFRLAIDDFGSGPMNIERLALVAFTEVKIRSSFVSGAEGDHGARAGLAVGLELAQQLKLAATADGITSRQEWDLLRDWGCHHGQGPFIAAPLPADAVAGWAARWNASALR